MSQITEIGTRKVCSETGKQLGKHREFEIYKLSGDPITPLHRHSISFNNISILSLLQAYPPPLRLVTGALSIINKAALVALSRAH